MELHSKQFCEKKNLAEKYMITKFELSKMEALDHIPLVRNINIIQGVK